MKIQKKQAIGENLLYVMVWAAIILVPVLNSQMMSEMHVNLENVLIAWRQIAPYLIIFLIHNAIIAPRYVLRRKYGKYLLSNLALIISVFWLVQIYEAHLSDHLPQQADPETLDAYRKASFSNLEMYWNVVLGFFMTGANTGIKLIYQSMRDEQQMEVLKRQNLQAEMDYLKYQINPHFFMNTLNNIHALIDIDTESAKNAVIELSKMMRYVLYDSGREIISLNRDIQFLKNYIELMRIRYTDDVDIRVDIPRPARAGVDPPAAADRVRRERLQARHQLQPSVVHPPADRICRQDGHRHALEQPPSGCRGQTGRHRAGKRPQAPGPDLRRKKLHARHPRGGADLYRKTRNPDAQCLNVSPSTTSRWLCVS